MSIFYKNTIQHLQRPFDNGYGPHFLHIMKFREFIILSRSVKVIKKIT